MHVHVTDKEVSTEWHRTCVLNCLHYMSSMDGNMQRLACVPHNASNVRQHMKALEGHMAHV